MHIKAAGEIRVDAVQKPQELLMPVTSVATADRYLCGAANYAEQGSRSCCPRAADQNFLHII
jgi:hypothetical protein